MTITAFDRAAWDACLAEFKPKPPRPMGFATPGELARALDPTTRQTPALDLIDAALVDVAEGRCPRLMISLPPQEGKSQRASRRFPTWMLTRNPDLRVAIVSYAFGIARRWGRAIRDDIAMHGGRLSLAISSSSSAANEWEIEGHIGGVYTVGIKGSLTSRAVDLLIIDDPYKDGEQADSEAWAETVQDFWTEVAIPRLGPGVAVVIIQTRWRDDDLTGWLQSRDDGVDWRVINIPAQADHNPAKGETDPLGREVGEYLESTRDRTEADWDQKKREVGSRSWNALYQGRPSPAEGGIFKRGWWQYATIEHGIRASDGTMRAPGFDQLLISVDATFKDSKTSDFVVMQVWGKRGARASLMDQIRGRWDFPTTCDQLVRLSAKWPQASLKLIEDKANGPAIIAQLRSQLPGLVAFTPQDSKAARASAVAAFVEAGNVEVPNPLTHDWVDAFIEEASAFPTGAHDDMVDTMTQALHRLLLGSGLSSFVDQLKNGG